MAFEATRFSSGKRDVDDADSAVAVLCDSEGVIKSMTGLKSCCSATEAISVLMMIGSDFVVWVEVIDVADDPGLFFLAAEAEDSEDSEVDDGDGDGDGAAGASAAAWRRLGIITM